MLRAGADPFARMPNPRDEERDELSAFEMLLSRNPKAAAVFLDYFVSSPAAAASASEDLDSSDLTVVFDFEPFDSEARSVGL